MLKRAICIASMALGGCAASIATTTGIEVKRDERSVEINEGITRFRYDNILHNCTLITGEFRYLDLHCDQTVDYVFREWKFLDSSLFPEVNVIYRLFWREMKMDDLIRKSPFLNKQH